MSLVCLYVVKEAKEEEMWSIAPESNIQGAWELPDARLEVTL